MNDLSNHTGYSMMALPWDTEFFDCKCAKLIIDEELAQCEFTNVLMELHNYDFITIVDRSGKSRNSEFIGDISGAFLVDIPIRLRKVLLKDDRAGVCSKEIETFAEGGRINDVDNSTELNQKLSEIAKMSFEQARFFRDSHISRNRAEMLYENWFKNACSKKDCVVFAQSAGKGFSVISCTEQKISLDIELVAVSENSRGKGIGSDLLRAINSYAICNKYTYIDVDTQAHNVSAMNFYSSNGFKCVNSSIVYHYWRDK